MKSISTLFKSNKIAPESIESIKMTALKLILQQQHIDFKPSESYDEITKLNKNNALVMTAYSTVESLFSSNATDLSSARRVYEEIKADYTPSNKFSHQ